MAVNQPRVMGNPLCQMLVAPQNEMPPHVWSLTECFGLGFIFLP